MGSSRTNPRIDQRRQDGDPVVEAWWDGYLKSLQRQGVATKVRPWYRRRVEQLMRRRPGVGIKRFSAADVTAHLTAIDGLGWPSWHMVQVVDALEHFGRHARMPWLAGDQPDSSRTGQRSYGIDRALPSLSPVLGDFRHHTQVLKGVFGQRAAHRLDREGAGSRLSHAVSTAGSHPIGGCSRCSEKEAGVGSASRHW